MLQTKRAIAIGHDSKMNRTHTALLVKSLIYVPLILQNKPIGVLGVTNRLKETSFDSNDTRALSALAGYATIAINNANIYSDIDLERDTLAAVVEQTDDPILIVDEQMKLILINNAGREAFDLPDVKLTGHPIDKLIKNEVVAQFIMQTSNEEVATVKEISLDNGRNFKMTLSLIEGGTRTVLMREIKA